MNPQRGGSDFGRLMLLALGLGLAAGLGTFALLVVLRCTTSWGEVSLPATNSRLAVPGGLYTIHAH